MRRKLLTEMILAAVWHLTPRRRSGESNISCQDAEFHICLPSRLCVFARDIATYYLRRCGAGIETRKI
jgi:hypothetical protein